MCEFNDENRIFCHESYKHDNADLTKYVQCLIEIPQREHRTCQCHRHAKKDDEGIDKTFELCGEYEINQNQSE